MAKLFASEEESVAVGNGIVVDTVREYAAARSSGVVRPATMGRITRRRIVKTETRLYMEEKNETLACRGLFVKSCGLQFLPRHSSRAPISRADTTAWTQRRAGSLALISPNHNIQVYKESLETSLVVHTQGRDVLSNSRHQLEAMLRRIYLRKTNTLLLCEAKEMPASHWKSGPTFCASELSQYRWLQLWSGRHAHFSKHHSGEEVNC